MKALSLALSHATLLSTGLSRGLDEENLDDTILSLSGLGDMGFLLEGRGDVIASERGLAGSIISDFALDGMSLVLASRCRGTTIPDLTLVRLFMLCAVLSERLLELMAATLGDWGSEYFLIGRSSGLIVDENGESNPGSPPFSWRGLPENKL